ncbi:hypothetical protein Tco_1437309 [Tanacetum coccineum]
MLLMQAQENRVALDEEQLLFIADAFDSDVDEAPTAQTMFMANLSSADPVYDEAGLSYDSDILSEVHDHDHYQDVVCEHHEEHEMHDDVQPNYVVDSHANYMSDSNMIPYDRYVKDNAVPVVQSNVSPVPNDAYMMIFNDMHEPHAQSVSDTTQNTVVDNSLTTELATYKEQVELYERRAKFELTKREQKIDEQLRIVISDHNIKEENLKKELHSVKMKLASTINHNKSMVKEVASLKKDFKQNENKYLEEFLDIKALKEKVAIGYKNPLCLTHAKQVQHALYNGYEIIKNNHVPALVHNTEDTLEIAEITRRKMNDKMKDPECVTHKVKIASPDYSKENYFATFTPQKHLTPEQIFWSQDLIKMKEEALKGQTTASRPIKSLMVYSPNTSATLFPRVLPTKSQVKINIFTLIQLFSQFEKTCKKRITPTGLTEGEMGFEQTKECYLTKVIPFFKTLKEHFDCILEELETFLKNWKLKLTKTLSRGNIFTEMHDAHTIVEARCLELKAELSNLCKKIQNDNHNELVKRFSNLEVNHLNLQLKYQNLKESFGNNPSTPARDTPDFDSTFVIRKIKASLQGKDNVINKLKTRISHLQETRSEADHTLDFRVLDFQITQLTEKSFITKDHVKPTVLAPGKYAIDVELIPPRNRNNREVHLDYLKHFKESVETLREIVEEAKVERPLDRSIVFACRYTKYSQELLEYTIGTYPKDFNKRDKKHAPTPLISKKQVTFEEQCDTGSQPRSNTKKNKISPAKGVNNKKVEEHPRINKSNLRTTNRVNSSSSSKRTAPPSIHNSHNVVRKVKQVRQVWKPTSKVLTSVGHQWRPTGRLFTLGEQCPLTRLTAPKVVVQIVLWYLDSSCSKHMTGDHSRLRNFVKKFIRTVRFGNDHFCAIIGYGDYVIGDSVISRVYYVEGLGHNLFSVGQFCDSDLEVAFRKHTCYVRYTDGVELIKGSRGLNLYTISVEDMMKSSPICLLSKASKKDQSKKRKLVKETSDAPSPAKRSKVGKVTKQRKPKSPLQLVDEFVDEGVLEQELVYGDEEADIQRATKLSIKEQAERTLRPARPVVIREPDSGRIQPLPYVHGKGKEKRRTPTITEPSSHAESPSLYAELGLTDSETKFDEEVSSEINAGTQDEGQSGPNPGDQDEGQARPNPGPNLEHMDFEVTNASTQQNPKQMDEEFTTMAYPSVQENLKLPT